VVGPPIAASVAPAVIALVGTLVGALIGSVTTVTLERWRRRDEGRAFARLVEDELQSAEDVVDEWLASYPNIPPQRSRGTLDTTAWDEGRTLLAHRLRRGRWDTVRDGCRELARLRRSLESGVKPLSEDDILTARKRVIAARETLHGDGVAARVATRLWSRGRTT
jgi:hypothetical protein